ncbi:uncharacterized protein LOC131634920 [Vicia villosa]|uniref:uncharacterized protein LOC131634920 n=1 Tax=Vicia villosa TaxID=3911 RepID=UPI00273B344B|nr:uncharacterized protein LOC131634920 [Vicia villosa]
MVMEQQTRPQVTVEQIRQLILEQPRRNQGRNGRPRRGGDYDEEDKDGSDRSSLSRDSKPRHRRNRVIEVERYFQLNEVRTKDKLDVAMLAMEERALHWYQWWEEQTPLRTWDEFKLAVMRRFQPGLLHNPLGPLLSLKQKGSVGEYREKFEMMVAPLRREERIMLDSIFLNGLKDEIQAELKLHESQDLAELMDRALLIEEKNEVITKKGSFWNDRGGTFRLKDPAEAGGSKKDHEKNQVGGNDKGKGKRLDPAELEERSKKGLCFKCGDKWNREHVCKFKHMCLKLCEESSGEEGEEEVLGEDKLTIVEKVEELQTLQLPMKSRDGFTSNKSFKVWVEVKDKRLLTLIDSSATSNFLDSKVAAELALKVVETPTYVIEVGNGDRVRNKGVCEGLRFKMQGVNFNQHFFMMELGGTYMVLGMEWLASLGKIEANFGELSLKWEKEGQLYEIKGDPALCVRQSTWKSIFKSLKEEGMGFYLQSMEFDMLSTIGEQKEWEEILRPFEEVFNLPSGLPPIRAHDHAIRLKPDVAIPNLMPYRYPFYQKNEIEKIVKDMLQAGIVRHSTSPFSSPVLLVKKKDGGWRFCADYRALNKVTIPNKFPIPVIEELLDELGGAMIFSKLDLKARYHQIRMKEEDVSKTAFRTHEGHYEYLVMPFGLTNAPSTFQALMNEVLRPYLRKFCLEIEYLGHLISGDGVSADPKKIEDMLKWPSTKDLKGLRGFLGLTGYYRKFVKNYGKIAWPLTQLLKKDSFLWNQEAQVAFEALKMEMTTIPVLALPDFEKEFVLETDASGKGIRAVLMQEGRPISYMSQTLSARAQQKSVYERELMAMVIAIQKWRPYLLGRHFKVHTDQKSLKFITEQRIMGEEQQKWLSKLVGYDFEVKYKPGKENSAANSLARQMLYATITTILSYPKIYPMRFASFYLLRVLKLRAMGFNISIVKPDLL